MKAENPKEATSTEIKPEFNYGAELNKFETEVALASHRGIDWIETHPEIVDFFNKKGLNGADYFVYKGVKVAAFGKAQEIEDRHNVPMQERLHGPAEGKIVGR